MANFKSLIAELQELNDDDREFLYRWHTKLAERGYDVPTGEQLRNAVEQKERRERQEEDET
jgi:ActR/RegA family two-component response regulator